MAITSTTCRAIFFPMILNELKNDQKGPSKILCDNKSSIALTKDPVFHGRSKHISIKFHYIRELLKHNKRDQT